MPGAVPNADVYILTHSTTLSDGYHCPLVERRDRGPEKLSVAQECTSGRVEILTTSDLKVLLSHEVLSEKMQKLQNILSTTLVTYY